LNIPILLRCASVALVLGAPPALAKKANETGQTPPDVKGVSDGCVSHVAGFKRRGDRAMFVIDVRNICERRFRCQVTAHITTSQGPKQVRAVMTLGPQSRGKAAQKSHVTPLPEDGGMASVSHKCRKA
jgi:hypothetical protein